MRSKKHFTGTSTKCCWNITKIFIALSTFAVIVPLTLLIGTPRFSTTNVDPEASLLTLDPEVVKRLEEAERIQLERSESVWKRWKPPHPLLENPEGKPFVQRDASGRPKNKLILIHGDYYKKGQNPFLKGFNFLHCRVPHCTWTRNRSKSHEADAVWLHVSNYGPRLDPLNDSPAVRPKDKSQIWVASFLEWDAVGCQEASYGLDGFVNWSMSYRRDADVWWPYGYAIITPSFMRKPISLWNRIIGRIIRRSKHCKTESKRTEYVQELSKYIQIDSSGTRGDCLGVNSKNSSLNLWDDFKFWATKTFKLKKESFLFKETPGWLSDTELSQLLREKYRFVIAFENGLCENYFTEKFWKIGLNLETVPIVRGGKSTQEIQLWAPPGSYINSREFKSPEELALFLKRVASNSTLFRSYFEWKKVFSLGRTDLEDIRWSFETASGDALTGFCHLCEKLHSKKLVQKSMKWSNYHCWEERGPEKYATKYSGCTFANDI